MMILTDALSRWDDVNHNIEVLNKRLAELKEERSVLELCVIPQILAETGNTKLEIGEYSIPVYKFIEVLSSGSARELVKAVANRQSTSGTTGSGDDLVQVAENTGFKGVFTKLSDDPVF